MSVYYYQATTDALILPSATALSDLFQITNLNPTTVKVRVLWIGLISWQTTAGMNKFYIAKRSSPDTGGVQQIFTQGGNLFAPFTDDSPMPPNADVRAFGGSPVPTMGPLIGYLDTAQVLAPTLTSLIQPGYCWVFSKNGIPGIQLNGTDCICVSAQFTTPAGLQTIFNVGWSEEL